MSAGAHQPGILPGTPALPLPGSQGTLTTFGESASSQAVALDTSEGRSPKGRPFALGECGMATERASLGVHPEFGPGDSPMLTRAHGHREPTSRCFLRMAASRVLVFCNLETEYRMFYST